MTFMMVGTIVTLITLGYKPDKKQKSTNLIAIFQNKQLAWKAEKLRNIACIPY